MHTFFATNNLGGGGTNVSRFLLHLDKINTKHIGLLQNYYYLTLQSSPAFDVRILNEISNFSNIKDFIRFFKSYLIEKNRKPSNVNINIDDSIVQYILDSGSGNILRDLINNRSINEASLCHIVDAYITFANNLEFDLTVALDYALKYTYRNDENLNDNYQRISNLFVNDEKANLKILETTLKSFKNNNINIRMLAPLHGYDFESYSKYLDAVLELEKSENKKFFGFAIGGIGDVRKLKNQMWMVPNRFKLAEKSLWITSNLTKNISENIGNRKLHILGAGNITNIPFIIHYGASSSDCHSAWRRANDGDTKILIPLINSKLEFIDNENSWNYVKLSEIDFIDCDCPICKEYSLDNIKSMISNTNIEVFYFAKIIIFIHALYQYDYIISFCQKNSNYMDLLLETPNNKLNNIYRKVLDNII